MSPAAHIAPQGASMPLATGSATAGFAWAISRDLTLALRHPGGTMLTLAFFVLVASLFPLGVGADPQLLARIGPGVIWVCALLAAFLSLGSLFADDFADGTLEQMMLSPDPVFGWVSGKIAAHWMVSGLPLTLLSPLLSLLGSACAALSLGARGGGTLLALLALPLFVPVLIFGAGAADAASNG